MLLKNALVVGKNEVEAMDVRISQGKITGIGKNLPLEAGENGCDLTGKYLMAGFIDSHTHGAMDTVYFREDDLDIVTDLEVSRGVTAVAATLSSQTMECFERCAKNVLAYMRKGTRGAKIAGIHFDGPFLNVERKGGMKEECLIPPTMEDFERIYDFCEGELKILTIAPELEGSLEVIRAAASRGVTVSAGHTAATFEQMKEAIDAGVSRMTHTFNASVGFNHRNPGVLGAAMTDSRVMCEVICDFTHLHPATVELLYKVKGADGFCAISDSEFCAGLEENKVYSFNGRTFRVENGVAWLPNGTICGSAGDLLLALKNLRSLGIPLPEISRMLSANPAKGLGIFDQTGEIATGKLADLVILDENLQVKATLVEGNCVFGQI